MASRNVVRAGRTSGGPPQLGRDLARRPGCVDPDLVDRGTAVRDRRVRVEKSIFAFLLNSSVSDHPVLRLPADRHPHIVLRYRQPDGEPKVKHVLFPALSRITAAAIGLILR